MIAKCMLTGLVALGFAGVAAAQEQVPSQPGYEDPAVPPEQMPQPEGQQPEGQQAPETGKQEGQGTEQKFGEEQKFGQEQKAGEQMGGGTMQVPQSLWFSLADYPINMLDEARETFKKDGAKASRQLKSVSEFVNVVLSSGEKGPAGDQLQQASQELEQFAQKVHDGQVDSSDAFDPVLAKTSHALASYYHWQASQAIQKQDGKAAGYYLGAAHLGLKNAADWADVTLSDEIKDSLNLTGNISGQLIENPGTIPPDAQKALDGIQQGIQEVGNRLQKPEGAT